MKQLGQASGGRGESFATAMPLYQRTTPPGEGVCWMVDKVVDHLYLLFLRG
jgi:hypothetical protein